jgi:prolipoprotein diacylglyceryltransferase
MPDWFWAYNYPNNVLNEGIPIPGCLGNHCSALPNAVFPTPLYEAIACIGMFGILWSVRKYFTTPGTFFFFYLLLNGIERFLIEKIRVNTNYHIFGNDITQAELISSAFILISIVALVYLKLNRKKVA